MTPEGAQTSRRDSTFDILKGIGISEVVVHHVLSHSARKYAALDSADWWVMTVLNRLLHFAVPTFLFASAVLLARSMASKPKPDWGRYYKRRVSRTLAPYLVWSLIYIAFRILMVRIGDDVAVTPVSLPWGATVELPALIASGKEWARNLLVGKSYYHLYFMSVLLQFAVVFPVLFILVRRANQSFAGAAAVAAVLQLGGFWLFAAVMRPVFGFNEPASTLLWYVLPVYLGTWVGLHWSEWPAVWQRWRSAICLFTALGLAVYFTLAVRIILGLRVSSLAYNSGIAVYAMGAALVLLVWSRRLALGGKLGTALARIGDWSLPIFLVHPLLLYLLSGPTITRVLDWLPGSFFWTLAALAFVTWGFTELTIRLRLDRYLFGRRFTSPSKEGGA